MASGSEMQLVLVVRAPNGDVREVALRNDALVIGRDESADIRVDDRKVSRRHAAFRLIEAEVWVEDLGSSNGVRLNDQKIDKRARVDLNDEVKVGGFKMFLKHDDSASMRSSASQALASSASAAADGMLMSGRSFADGTPMSGPSSSDDSSLPRSVGGTAPVPQRPRVVERGPPDEEMPRLMGLDRPVKGRTYVLQRGENIVGRLDECDVPILDGSVSRQHARVVFTRQRLTVTDLGSSNGVFVNDLRVDMAQLAEGDVLRVGNVAFSVRLPDDLAKQEPAPLLTRARARRAPGDRRWLTLGVVGLVLAILVLGAAFALQMRKNRPRGLFAKAPGVVSTSTGTFAETVDAPTTGNPALAEPPLVTAKPAVANKTADKAGVAVVGTPPPSQTVKAVPPPSGPRAAAAAPRAGAPSESDVWPPSESAVLASIPTLPTATSPFSRKGSNGLPINLPDVDPEFDFQAFSVRTMGEAKTCETSGDFACVRERLATLLNRDPINKPARVMLTQVHKIERAQAAMAQADRYVARGDNARALRALAEAPTDGPRANVVRERADQLKERAISEELTLAAKEARRRRSWRRAHRRFKYVLKLDPESMVALDGLRQLEHKMRQRKIGFNPYRPPSKTGETNSSDDAAIRQQFDEDERLVEIARAYARGALNEATKRARSVARRYKGPRARTARAMRSAIEEVRKRYRRTKTEIANDPDHAWAMLIDLERFERRILPRGTKSFIVRELEVSLSEAFADRGRVQFDRRRYEDAFQRWESGFKLDATNPKILAGLKRLEDAADKQAQEAELAGQRGDPDVCDRWKRITRMTRSESEIHQRARKRAFATCR